MTFRMGVTISGGTVASGNIGTVDTSELERASRDLDALANEMPWVAVRAINKAMVGVKTDMKGVVRERYNYKASALEKRMSISRATRARIEGYIQSKGELVHLTDITGTRQTARGVMVNVRKDTGRQLIPRAFISHGQHSGKRIVFRRKGSPPGQIARLVPRYPIVAVSTAHPEVIYNAPENWAKIAVKTAERLDTNIARETDAEFRRQAGKW